MGNDAITSIVFGHENKIMGAINNLKSPHQSKKYRSTNKNSISHGAFVKYYSNCFFITFMPKKAITPHPQKKFPVWASVYHRERGHLKHLKVWHHIRDNSWKGIRNIIEVACREHQKLFSRKEFIKYAFFIHN